MRGQKHIERFQRFRSGWGFVLALGVFIVSWLGAHRVLVGFDPDLLLLNLVLSIEASFAMPVLLMAQEAAGRRESEKLRQVLEATHQLLAKIDQLAGEDG